MKKVMNGRLRNIAGAGIIGLAGLVSGCETTSEDDAALLGIALMGLGAQKMGSPDLRKARAGAAVQQIGSGLVDYSAAKAGKTEVNVNMSNGSSRYAETVPAERRNVDRSGRVPGELIVRYPLRSIALKGVWMSEKRGGNLMVYKDRLYYEGNENGWYNLQKEFINSVDHKTGILTAMAWNCTGDGVIKIGFGGSEKFGLPERFLVMSLDTSIDTKKAYSTLKNWAEVE